MFVHAYRPPGDAWTRLASLMNLLEKLDKNATTDSFTSEQREGIVHGNNYILNHTCFAFNAIDLTFTLLTHWPLINLY